MVAAAAAGSETGGPLAVRAFTENGLYKRNWSSMAKVVWWAYALKHAGGEEAVGGTQSAAAIAEAAGFIVEPLLVTST